MIPRYTTPEMAAIWSDANRYRRWLDVELAATEAWENIGRIEAGITGRLREKAATIDFDALAKRALEIEETTRHDVIAFLGALEEVLGEESRHIHYGMTSSDVVDTAFALLLQEAGAHVLQRTNALFEVALERAKEQEKTLCLGRTHGQAAEPTSFGLKLLGVAAELDRARRRLRLALDDIRVGKLSGAVGNYGNIAPEVEAIALEKLGLRCEDVATQVVPRDRHAQFFSTLAVIGGAVERFSVEVRHLMRTEVSEAFEPFGKGQRGSSAMPHKRNPILTENLTGQARLLRAYASAALENQALWHERDISHSSVERMIAPDATATLDFSLKRMHVVLAGLEVDKEAMAKHIEDTGGLIYSEGVLLALVDTGVLRQEAYGWVQVAAKESRAGQGPFAERVKAHPEIAKRLEPARVDELFDPHHHLRHVGKVFARVEANVRENLPAPALEKAWEAIGGLS